MPKKSLICGGNGRIDIRDSNKNVVASIFYRRPEYEEVLSYEYEYFDGVSGEIELKQIGKGKDKIQKTHSVVVKKLFMPHAEKIFTGSTGYLDENKKPLENKSVAEQFEHIKKYYGYHLVEMAAHAFKADTTCKKKD